MQRLALVLTFLGLACVCGKSVAAFDEDLHAAIRAGDIEAVRSKVARGVDLEPACRPNFNCKPLVYAAFLGRRQIVEVLVDAGADLNGTSPVGDTALVKSLLLPDTQLGREMAKYLMAKGADVNKPNVFGMTAFIGACGVGDLEIINLMLAHGAMVDSAFPSRLPVPPGETDRETCLHMAAKHGQLDAARLVLRAGANPKVRNSGGKLPQHYAEQAGRKDLVELLSTYATEQAELQLAQWLPSAQYQQGFNKQVRGGFYPKTVEGRCEDGSEQFRAEWGGIPSGAGFYSHHALTKSVYEAKNAEYVSQGYSLQSVTNFKDCSGIERYQATWINTSGPLPVASSIAAAAPRCVPKPSETPAATYPRELREADIAGVVTFQFRVLPDGSVADVRVAPPSRKELIPIALQTVEKWRFEPHACGGDFGVVMQASMTFHLE